MRDSSRFILCDLESSAILRSLSNLGSKDISLFPKAKLFEVAPDSLSKGDPGKKEEKTKSEKLSLLWGAQIMPAERRKRPSSRGRDSSSDASRCAMVTHQMHLRLDVTRIRPTCARENLVMRISSLEILCLAEHFVAGKLGERTHDVLCTNAAGAKAKIRAKSRLVGGRRPLCIIRSMAKRFLKGEDFPCWSVS